MKNLGFMKAIATPHTYKGLYNNSKESIKKSYDTIKNKSGINIRYASEYMIDNTLIEKISNGSLLTLKDDYVLVEMSYFSKEFRNAKIERSGSSSLEIAQNNRASLSQSISTPNKVVTKYLLANSIMS